MGKQIEDKKTFSQIISVGLIFIGAGLCLSVSFNLDRCAYKEKALPSLQEETSLVYQNCMTAINEELNVLGKNSANDIIGLHIFNNYIYLSAYNLTDVYSWRITLTGADFSLFYNALKDNTFSFSDYTCNLYVGTINEEEVDLSTFKMDKSKHISYKIGSTNYVSFVGQKDERTFVSASHITPQSYSDKERYNIYSYNDNKALVDLYRYMLLDK